MYKDFKIHCDMMATKGCLFVFRCLAFGDVKSYCEKQARVSGWEKTLDGWCCPHPDCKKAHQRLATNRR